MPRRMTGDEKKTYRRGEETCRRVGVSAPAPTVTEESRTEATEGTEEVLAV